MAFGSSTFTDISGAVGDLFSASGDRAKAQGDFIEAQDYTLASDLATQNEQFAATSTAIKQAQQDRQLYMFMGGERADTAGAGFAASGSSLDLLRSSASQGALTKAVLGQQGLIQEAGYQEQAESYQNMSEAATIAGNAENNAANGADVSAIFKGLGAVASLFTGGASNILGGLLGGGSSDGFSPQTPDPGNPLVINRYGQPGPAWSSSTNPATPLGAIY
jgi:hypothetical protein